jgi:hypothetical protein
MAQSYIERLLQRPAQSFFLFGPRGTGKSTWVDLTTVDSYATVEVAHRDESWVTTTARPAVPHRRSPSRRVYFPSPNWVIRTSLEPNTARISSSPPMASI